MGAGGFSRAAQSGPAKGVRAPPSGLLKAAAPREPSTGIQSHLCIVPDPAVAACAFIVAGLRSSSSSSFSVAVSSSASPSLRVLQHPPLLSSPRRVRALGSLPVFGAPFGTSRGLFPPHNSAAPAMSDTAVDTSSEISTKDLKEKKEVVEETENGRDAPANGNAENEENGEQEADNEVDDEEEEVGDEEEDEEEGDGEEEDGDEDDEAEGLTGKRAAEDDEDDDVDPKKQKTDEDD